jgi:hypothetical protein
MGERDMILLRIAALFTDIHECLCEIHRDTMNMNKAIMKLIDLIEDNNAETPPIPGKMSNCS